MIPQRQIVPRNMSWLTVSKVFEKPMNITIAQSSLSTLAISSTINIGAMLEGWCFRNPIFYHNLFLKDLR